MSRDVIIRRLLDQNIINSVEYSTYNAEILKERNLEKEEMKKAREEGRKTGIPRDVCREAIDRTSPTVSKTLLYGFNEKILSKRDISHHLGISLKHIDKFIKEVSKWSN